MDSYRVEIQSVRKIQLADDNAEIDPVLIDSGGKIAEPELDCIGIFILFMRVCGLA